MASPLHRSSGHAARARSLSYSHHHHAHHQQAEHWRPSFTMSEWRDKMNLVHWVLDRFGTDLSELVMDFFVIEGYKDTARLFQQEASIDPEMDLESITDRMQVRESLQSGDVPAAIEKIEQLHPTLLSEGAELMFHLKQQQLVELIRKGDIDTALAFAQKELSSLGQGSPQFLDELERTMTLLAFDVNNKTSPVAPLLETQQRLKVANEANAAILTAQGQEKEAKLIDLLRMLKWTQDKVARQGATFPHITSMSDASFSFSSSSSTSGAVLPKGSSGSLLFRT